MCTHKYTLVSFLRSTGSFDMQIMKYGPGTAPKYIYGASKYYISSLLFRVEKSTFALGNTSTAVYKTKGNMFKKESPQCLEY